MDSNISIFLEEINKQMREGAYFEEAVAELIRKLRDKKVLLDLSIIVFGSSFM